MAIRQARWLGFAGVGLLAIVGGLIGDVEADHPSTGPQRSAIAAITIPARPGSPVRVVATVLGREPGPWPIVLRARGVGVVDRSAPSAELAGPIEAAPIPAIPKEPSSTVPALERAFHLFVGGDPGEPGHYRRVQARLVASGRDAQVYRDEDDPGDSSLADDLLVAYENVILPRCERWIGRPRDVDGDGRLTILLSSRVGSLGEGGEPVTGCVRPADFQDRMPEPFGNRCDLITIDARLDPGPHARTVLAHEYAHAVVAGRKGLQPDGSSDGSAEEDWLDEALAHVVESRLGLSRSNLDHRVAAFRQSTERYGLVIADYQARGLMRSPGHRGAAFGFLDFCTRRYGPGLIARLANAPETGEASVERATGRSLDRLIADWAVEEGRHVEVTDRIRADDEGATWLARGTTFHVVEVDPGRAPGMRIEAYGPPGVAIVLGVVESERPR